MAKLTVKIQEKKKKSLFLNAGIIVNYVALPIIILILWNYITKNNFFSAALLPAVPTVVESFVSQLKSGQLVADIFISLTRVLKGFFMAAIAGIALGIIMGVSKKTNRFFAFTFNSIRQIPMIAWMPMIILWFGIEEASKVIIIFIGAFFPVLINTISGIKQIPKGYLEVGRMYRLSKWQQFIKIYLPASLPSIFVGLKLALGISWMIVVAAEMIAASSGIGYRINDARSLMEPEVVIVGMLIIGIVGIIMDCILFRVSKLITPWSSKT